MKKIIITSLVAMMAATGANAATEWFVGGSVGLGYEKDDFIAFNIAPEVGYNVTDKFDVGAMVKFAQWDDKAPGADYTETSFGGGLFARYNVVSFGNFNVLLKGIVYVDLYNISAGSTDIDTTTFGAKVLPMVTYQLSESFSLFAELNFLNVGIEKVTSDVKAWETTSAGFNIDTNDVKNTADIQIGFNYHF